MQIITQGDYLMFISEDPTVEEKDKVQAFKWSDIQTISFRYPSKNYFRYIKNGLGLLAGIFIGSDVSGISNNHITIEVYLKTGKKEFQQNYGYFN